MTYRELAYSNYKEEKEKKQEYEISVLYQRIDSITKTCSKLYFNKILKRLAEENQENAIIICDYVTAEETELNIKNSTKKVG